MLTLRGDAQEEEAAAGTPAPSEGGNALAEQPARPSGKTVKAADAGMQTSTSFDEETHVCEARVSVRLGAPKLLMLKLVEQVAADTVVKATPGAPLAFICLFIQPPGFLGAECKDVVYECRMQQHALCCASQSATELTEPPSSKIAQVCRHEERHQTCSP